MSETTLTIPASLMRWCSEGERGLSSSFIAQRLTGMPLLKRRFDGPDTEAHHPYDPDDLRRCALLLEACPELQERFGEMAQASPTWARLVAVEAGRTRCPVRGTMTRRWVAAEGSTDG